jgi:hypothetical protein
MEKETTLTDLPKDILQYYLPKFLDDPQDRTNLRAVCRKFRDTVPGPAHRITRSALDVAWRIFADLFTLGLYEVYNQYRFFQAIEADDLGAIEKRWRWGASLFRRFHVHVPLVYYPRPDETSEFWKPHLSRWATAKRKDLLSVVIRQDPSRLVCRTDVPLSLLALQQALLVDKPDAKLVRWIGANLLCLNLHKFERQDQACFLALNFRPSWPAWLGTRRLNIRGVLEKGSVCWGGQYRTSRQFMEVLAQATPEEAKRHRLRATTDASGKRLLAYAQEAGNDALAAYLEKG